MPHDAERLTADVLTLPRDERARLAEILLISLEEDVADADLAAIDAEWISEAERRDRELDANPGLARPVATVFDAIEHRLRDVARHRAG